MRRGLSHELSSYVLRGIVTEERHHTLFIYYPASKQIMTSHVIVRVLYNMNKCIEIFIFHETRPITWSVVVCAERGWWLKSVKLLSSVTILFQQKKNCSCDSSSAVYDELVFRRMHFLCESGYHMNWEHFFWRGMLTEDILLTPFSYYPPSTRIITVHLIVRVSYNMNKCIELFIFHANRTISRSVVICVEEGR